MDFSIETVRAGRQVEDTWPVLRTRLEWMKSCLDVNLIVLQ